MTTKLEVDLVYETCCACGTPFAMEATLEQNLRKMHTWFYCPNGHSQHYTAKSDSEKLAEVERKNLSLRQELDQAEADAAQKGKQLASLRKRAKAGLCTECRRHFVNLERHMASKHSERSPSGRKAT
jgi:hypothetical protein